jgi:hypothetical protein
MIFINLPFTTAPMKKKFYWRSYVSFSLVLSFLMITISGIVLYLAPPGRIARWTEWMMLGFRRAQWEDLHTLFSYMFIFFGFFHLLMFNWKLFFSYIRSKITRRLNRTREMIFSLLTFGIIFGFTLVKIPPIYSVMQLGNNISDGWAGKKGSPPIAYAEEMTFRDFSVNILGSDPEVVVAKLSELGYRVDDTGMRFEEVAKENGLSPVELFEIVTRYFIIKTVAELP